jgi:hypothetical protein
MAVATGTAILGAAAIGGGVALASGAMGSRAAGQAASAQADAANQAASAQLQSAREQIAAQERMFERQVELQEPWRQAGVTALNQLTPLASQYTPFGMEQFRADPGYQFRLSEGMKALDRQAAARGGLISGGALKAAQRFGQELGSQEYGSAFGRYITEREAQLNPLQSLAGVGQTSTNQLANAAGATGTNISNILGSAGQAQAQGILGAGQARASGYVGQANALSGALGGISSNISQGVMLNALLNPGATGSPFLAGGGGGF